MATMVPQDESALANRFRKFTALEKGLAIVGATITIGAAIYSWGQDKGSLQETVHDLVTQMKDTKDAAAVAAKTANDHEVTDQTWHAKTDLDIAILKQGQEFTNTKLDRIADAVGAFHASRSK